MLADVHHADRVVEVVQVRAEVVADSGRVDVDGVEAALPGVHGQ
jgi:hypothetical protein